MDLYQSFNSTLCYVYTGAGIIRWQPQRFGKAVFDTSSSRMNIFVYPIESQNDDPVSATQPDWSREKLRLWWDPSRQLIKAIRSYQRRKVQRGILANLFCKYHVLEYRFWSVVTGADIPLNCHLGGGLILLHPNGIVLGPEVKMGPNCLIAQQVTIVDGVCLGGHVDIGAGAKLIRPVTIGDHAKIGANAVVLTDVPPGATAVGIPAKIIPARDSGAG